MQRAGLHPRRVEQVVNEPSLDSRVPFDRVDRLCHVGWQLALPRNGAPPEHRRKRAAQLVGKRRHEIVLDAAGAFGFGPGRAFARQQTVSFRLGALTPGDLAAKKEHRKDGADRAPDGDCGVEDKTRRDSRRHYDAPDEHREQRTEQTQPSRRRVPVPPEEHGAVDDGRYLERRRNDEQNLHWSICASHLGQAQWDDRRRLPH